MKTTLNLNDTLLVRAKSAAAREHTSLTRLIEEGLTLRLRPVARAGARGVIHIPVYAGTGGLTTAVSNPACNRSLLDAADGEREA